MSRPGDRIRQLAARICSERTRRRLIDPAIADLQAEVATARRAGSKWQMPRALGAGYVSVVKMLVVAVGADLRRSATTWKRAEASGARAGAWAAAITVLVATVLLEANALSRFDVHASFPGWSPGLDLLVRARLAAHLVPSMLLLSLPLGLAIGVAWAFHGAARTRKLAGAAVLIATLGSAAMFVTVAWLTPQASQAFRQIAIARFFHWDEDRPLAAGHNELTIPALRTRLEQARTFGLPQTPRFFETLYYRKLAQTAAAIPLVGVVLGLAFRRPWSRGALTSVAVAVYAAHHLGLMSSAYVSALLPVPPIVAGWTPTASFAVAALLLAALPRHTSTPGYAR